MEEKKRSAFLERLSFFDKALLVGLGVIFINILHFWIIRDHQVRYLSYVFAVLLGVCSVISIISIIFEIKTTKRKLVGFSTISSLLSMILLLIMFFDYDIFGVDRAYLLFPTGSIILTITSAVLFMISIVLFILQTKKAKQV